LIRETFRKLLGSLGLGVELPLGLSPLTVLEIRMSNLRGRLSQQLLVEIMRIPWEPR
jgi:hypothetical protein